MTKRVLLVDDHAMFRWGVRQFIAGLEGFSLAGEAGDGEAALALIAREAVDIVLLDLDMPGLDGTGFLAALRGREAPSPKVVILSQSFSEAICRKLQSGGIDGYVLKTEGIDEVGEALAAVAGGDTHFSPGIAKRLWAMLREVEAEAEAGAEALSSREMEVARLVWQGLSNKVIAERLGCAQNTVKTHRANVMRKVGARNAAELARWVAEGNVRR